MFSLTFSEESSIEAEQKARIAQLEQQIETQNKIIVRYERVEDKLNDRVLETLDLNNKVDDFYNSAWTKLETQNSDEIGSLKADLKDNVNFIKDIVLGIIAIVGIMAIMPIYQSFKARSILEKIQNQEKELINNQKKLEEQSRLIDNQEMELKKLTTEIEFSLSRGYKLSGEVMLDKIDKITSLKLEEANLAIVIKHLLDALRILPEYESDLAKQQIEVIKTQYYRVALVAERANINYKKILENFEKEYSIELKILTFKES